MLLAPVYRNRDTFGAQYYTRSNGNAPKNKRAAAANARFYEPLAALYARPEAALRAVAALKAIGIASARIGVAVPELDSTRTSTTYKALGERTLFAGARLASELGAATRVGLTGHASVLAGGQLAHTVLTPLPTTRDNLAGLAAELERLGFARTRAAELVNALKRGQVLVIVRAGNQHAQAQAVLNQYLAAAPVPAFIRPFAARVS